MTAGFVRRGAVGAAALVLGAAAVAGCSSATSSAGGSRAQTLRMATVGGPLTAGFNPFSGSDAAASQGVTSLVYEPLIMPNLAKTDVYKPWLASAYKWSNDGKTITFTVPSGRTWSDGKPLTAADVAYTFNLIKKNPSLNVAGIDFASASAPNATTAVVNFASPGFTQMYALSKVLIVPEHIWSKVADPSKDPNTKPVGSGPYLLSSFSPQSIKFTKNPHYWQSGLPKVKNVEVDAYTTQNASNSAITAGNSDLATAFLQDVKKQWTGVDPQHYKMWLPAAGDFFLCPNTAVKPFDQLAVRQALAYSVDRTKSIKQVEGPFIQAVTSPTGIRAGQEEYQPSAYASSALTYDPSKVRSTLEKAGYKADGKGMMMQPDGKPLKVSLMLPSQYTDWMSLGELFVNQMKAAGIDASLDGVSVNAWTSNVNTGHYQVSFCGLWQTDSPYTTYNTLLNSTLSAPVGKAAVSNVVRWDNSTTDALLAKYRGSGNQAQQVAALKAVATQVAQQLPIIPLMAVTSYGEYSTKYFTGWPDASNPYQTNVREIPTLTDLLLHLKPVG